MKEQTFKTERLLLKPTELEDAPLFLEMLNTPKWLAHIGDRNVKSLEAAQDYIKTRVLPQHQRLGYGNYTVILASNGIKIGCCGLYDRDGLDGVDIGFSLLPAYEGQGFGYEASSKLKEAAFKNFNLRKIGAITVKENVASQGLLEKLGLSFIKYVTVGEAPEELMYYELVRPTSF